MANIPNHEIQEMAVKIFFFAHHSHKKKLVIDLDFWLDMISSKRAKLNSEGDLVEDFSPESRPISDRQKCT